MFKHNWLDEHVVVRVDSPAGRRYVTPTGNKLESVTTWLGRMQDNTWLLEWRGRIGEEAATKIATRAAARGTALHANVEQYLLNNEVNVADMSMLDKSLFAPFKRLLDEHVTDINALEYKLYSDTLRLAGTVDCVACYDAVPSVIDFKTAKNMKSKADIDSYFLQCSIYSYMIEEMYSIRLDSLVVLIAVEYENKVQVFKESRKNWTARLITELKATPPA